MPPGTTSVERGQRGRHEIRFFDVAAELLRLAERRVLYGNIRPEAPTSAQRSIEHRNGILVAIGRVLRNAAVRDEHEVVLRQVYLALSSALFIDDFGGGLLPARLADDYVFHLHAVLEAHPFRFEVLDERHHQRFILVVAGELQRRQVGQSADVMDETGDVATHLHGAVPLLEGEHRPPVEPEVGLEKLFGKDIRNAFVVELLLRSKEQPGNLLGRLVRQGELAVGMGRLAAVHRGPHLGKVGVFLVQPIEFVEHRSVLHLQ